MNLIINKVGQDYLIKAPKAGHLSLTDMGWVLNMPEDTDMGRVDRFTNVTDLPVGGIDWNGVMNALHL